MPLPDALLADRYRLIECIGRGAAGKVWRARDERLDRIVALKTVHVAADADAPGAVARFRREARASAAISSPFVVSVYDAGRDGDHAFLVMELLSGPSLKDLLGERGPLPLREGLRVTADVACGLAAAHAAGFVHRDLKPGNVVFGDAVPKIVDFGIARLADPGDATMTSASMVAGTAAYMSPEQAMGKSVGPASDAYALGSLLFTVFTGEPPFTHASAVEQATAQVREDPPSLAERRPDLPAALVSLAAQLLEKDAAARPSAAQVADALDALYERTRTTPTQIAASTPRNAHPQPVAPRARIRAGATRTPRRHHRWPWITTAILALAATATGAQAWQAQRPVEASPSPVVPLIAASTPAATPTLALPTLTRSSQPTDADTSSTPSDPAPRETRSAKPSRRPSSTQPSAAPTSTPAASPSASPTPTPTPSATATP